MSEVDDLRAVGDLMQSAGSRLAEWAEEWKDDVPMSYETEMALLELRDGIRLWTGVRRKSK